MKWTVGMIGGMVSGVMLSLLIGLSTGYGVFEPLSFMKLFVLSAPVSFFIMTRASSLQKTLGFTSLILSVEGFLLAVLSAVLLVVRTSYHLKVTLFFLILGILFTVVFGVVSLLAFAEKKEREEMVKTK